MSNKRDLHTLFIRHDTDFGTLSRKALSEVILKIILIQNSGTRVAQIKQEITQVIPGNISDDKIQDSLKILERNEKIFQKKGKYYVHEKIAEKLNKTLTDNQNLQERVFVKYLTGSESSIDITKKWFQDSLIKFFENYSMEWFNHLTQNGKFAPKKTDHGINTIIDETLLEYDGQIFDQDKEWLRNQFIKFYESEEHDENMMFWNYGMSLFSSRIITAKNYADKISIDTYKNGTFILDTNILMILDLEGHEFGKSFKSLDLILKQLSIKLKFLHITQEEYERAIGHRRADTMHVFESYDFEVLKTVNCPFVQTAIARGCKTPEDVDRMFQTLSNIPEYISEQSKIEKLDYTELQNEIDKGCSDEALKSLIDEIHFRRLKRNKRENPKTHDAGLIYGINFLRKTDPTWVITTDGTLKLYAIENIIRDETEIAIGLDTLIGLFAVNDGGIEVNSSDFAPLFKNLVKNSLIPEENVFDVRDLAFILSTNLRINDLESERVIEIAKGVRSMRIAGKEDDEISLFLRREIEGEKIEVVKDLRASKANESLAKEAKERAEKERDIFINEIRENRRAELRDEYDKELRNNRIKLISIPLIVGIILFFIFKYWLYNEDKLIQFIIGIGSSIIFGILPLFPLNKRLVRKHSEFVYEINSKVERELIEKRKNS
jgi:hypothetical protein